MQIKSFKKYKIPDKPGVYFFQKGKEVLYIGKATSLKSRVKSYFTKDLLNTRGPLLVEMLAQADKIDWQESDSVLEALILEATLIKKYQPKYNTEGKSDKSWNYICITKEDIPKVLSIRERQIDFQKSDWEANSSKTRRGRTRRGSLRSGLSASFGPFTNGGQLREAMKIIRRIFPYIDASASKRANYEFYKQVGLAPDISSSEGRKAYLLNIKNIRLLFEGKKKKILKDLEREMKTLAKEHEFERAGEIKRQLFSLKHINDVALLKNDFSNGKDYWEKTTFKIEAYDIAHMNGKNMVGVMTVVENGQVLKNEYRKFKNKTKQGADDTGALKEVLERRLAHPEWRYPNLIVVDGGIAQINTVEKILAKTGVGIKVVSVVKDEHHKPRSIKGDRSLARKYEPEILLANSEAHRFAITYHKNIRSKNFLK